MLRKILVIDDDDFVYLPILKRRGIDITQKHDINSFSDVEPFDIVICDIEGIARNMGLPHNGATLAAMLKEKYPQKKIAIHSAAVFRREYVGYYNKVDAVIPKACYDLDDWTTFMSA